MGKLFFKEGKKYRFSDYFDFNNSTEDIANDFGYSFDTKILDLPLSEHVNKNEVRQLQERFYEILPKLTLNSEMAKRDFMIAPILWSILLYVKAKIYVEYFIEIDEVLGGSLDYLIRSGQELIVIEAKKGDLDKGFNQLAAELIALDKSEQADAPASLYGAVSIGELWRFGVLERTRRSIYKDLHTYRVPEDLEKIFAIILGITQKV
ncbi:conserved hypothetical protein [Gammaproteobacteria bacterium]